MIDDPAHGCLEVWSRLMALALLDLVALPRDESLGIRIRSLLCWHEILALGKGTRGLRSTTQLNCRPAARFPQAKRRSLWGTELVQTESINFSFRKKYYHQKISQRPKVNHQNTPSMPPRFTNHANPMKKDLRLVSITTKLPASTKTVGNNISLTSCARRTTLTIGVKRSKVTSLSRARRSSVQHTARRHSREGRTRTVGSGLAFGAAVVGSVDVRVDGALFVGDLSKTRDGDFGVGGAGRGVGGARKGVIEEIGGATRGVKADCGGG